MCDPLIENALGKFSVTSVQAVNSAAILTINSRTLSWRAGRTSLLGESFSEVLAYRMGELPPSDLERSGSKAMARHFFKEMEAKHSPLFAIGSFIGRGKRSLRGLARQRRAQILGGTFFSFF